MGGYLAEFDKVSFSCDKFNFNFVSFLEYLRIVSSSELSSAALASRCPSLSFSAKVRPVTEENSAYNSHDTTLSPLTSRSPNTESACLRRETSWRIAWQRFWLVIHCKGSSPGGGGPLPREEG